MGQWACSSGRRRGTDMRDAGDERTSGYAPITAGLLPLSAIGIGVVRGGKALLRDVSLKVGAGAPVRGAVSISWRGRAGGAN